MILKDHSLYTGVMANYPVLGDDIEKDFVLQHVHRFNPDTEKFEPFGPRMSLLLNSRDCWSVQVGPGPEQELPTRSRWEQVMQIVLWVLLIATSFSVLAALVTRPTLDLLLSVLAFFSATAATWSLLGLVRYRLKSQSPSRWDDVTVQRLWLFTGATGMLTAIAWLAGAQPFITAIGLALAMALIVATMRVRPT